MGLTNLFQEAISIISFAFGANVQFSSFQRVIERKLNTDQIEVMERLVSCSLIIIVLPHSLTLQRLNFLHLFTYLKTKFSTVINVK